MIASASLFFSLEEKKDVKFSEILQDKRMSTFILRRLILLIPTVLGVFAIVFFLLHMIPGDPVEIMLGENALQADKVKMREDLGLNLPIHRQYFRFLSCISKGDMGDSYYYGRPVLNTILERIPATVELAMAGITVAILIAIPLGIISALNKHSFIDHGAMFFSVLGFSMPNFWLGPLLIIVFSIHLGWLPVSGRGSIKSLILPAITLGTGLSAILSRMTRSSMLDVLEDEYLTCARAKGVRERSVILKHALRNGLIPIISIMGLQIGSLLSGAIITEIVFSWPGIGTLLIQSIESRDYPLTQGCVIFISIFYAVINILTDIAYAIADPRIRY